MRTLEVTEGDREIADLLVDIWMKATPFYRISLQELAQGAGVRESDVWGAVRRRFEASTTGSVIRCAGCKRLSGADVFINSGPLLCRECRKARAVA